MLMHSNVSAYSLSHSTAFYICTCQNDLFVFLYCILLATAFVRISLFFPLATDGHIRACISDMVFERGRDQSFFYCILGVFLSLVLMELGWKIA